MKPQLYVTDWAPNGTNDLVIVRDGEIVDYLEEAVFGVDIEKCPHQLAVIDDTEELHAMESFDGSPYIAPTYGSIDLETLSECLAVSPCRSEEEAQARVLAFLNKHGVV